jgi:hypothetical protein
MHVPHPFATSAFIRTYNPSSFSLQAVQRMYGDLHLEEYNPRLGRPNTSGMTALEAARASPRGGTFDLRSFAVPIGYSGLQPVSALLAPEGEAGRTVRSGAPDNHGRGREVMRGVHIAKRSKEGRYEVGEGVHMGTKKARLRGEG